MVMPPRVTDGPLDTASSVSDGRISSRFHPAFMLRAACPARVMAIRALIQSEGRRQIGCWSLGRAERVAGHEHQQGKGAACLQSRIR